MGPANPELCNQPAIQWIEFELELGLVPTANVFFEEALGSRLDLRKVIDGSAYSPRGQRESREFNFLGTYTEVDRLCGDHSLQQDICVRVFQKGINCS